MTRTSQWSHSDMNIDEIDWPVLLDWLVHRVDSNKMQYDYLLDKDLVVQFHVHNRTWRARYRKFLLGGVWEEDDLEPILSQAIEWGEGLWTKGVQNAQ